MERPAFPGASDVPGTLLADAEHLVRNDDLLDLVRSLVDAADLRVPEVALALVAALPAADAFPERDGSVRVAISEENSWWYERSYHVALQGSDVDCAAG